MNWLSDFFYGDATVYDASGKAVKRKRFDTLRHAVRIKRARAKSVWKKLSKKNKCRVLIAGAILLFVLGCVLAYRYLPARDSHSKNTLQSIFPAPAAPVLPDFEPESITKDPSAQTRRWKYIVVHHSGGNSGSAQSFDTYHRETKGWQSLGYHFVIGNGKGQADGKVEAGPRWYAQQAGAHAHSAEHNEFGIGICLVGNFETQGPTPAQWKALVELAKRLSAQHNIPIGNIVGHNQIRQGGGTACPGKFLNLQALRDAVLAN